MAERVLTLRELNRATLARQMLLERADVPVPAAVEKLVGMQAQLAIAPYVGLWTRLRDFTRDDLASLIEAHKIVKATLMRSTLHLVTVDDYLWLHATLQPGLIRAWESNIKDRGRGEGVEIETVVAAAKPFIREQPRTFAEITAMLKELQPDADEGAMRYGVRTHLPMVQVPISGKWSYPGNPKFALAEDWLGQPIPTEENVRELVLRYLAAFGPASVTDLQTWSGLKVKDAVEKLRPDLRVYKDEGRRELYDLPDAPLPDAETPAPERFLPEFDNLLLSHAKRTRVVADEYRKQVYLPGLRVAATILVDGFVRGTWKVEKNKGVAALVITPFEKLTKQSCAALTEEADRLVQFVEAAAKSHEVRFME